MDRALIANSKQQQKNNNRNYTFFSNLYMVFDKCIELIAFKQCTFSKHLITALSFPVPLTFSLSLSLSVFFFLDPRLTPPSGFPYLFFHSLILSHFFSIHSEQQQKQNTMISTYNGAFKYM